MRAQILPSVSRVCLHELLWIPNWVRTSWQAPRLLLLPPHQSPQDTVLQGWSGSGLDIFLPTLLTSAFL